jgi:hypothetical protein
MEPTTSIFTSGLIANPGTPHWNYINNSHLGLTPTLNNNIMQNKVAVFKVTRDENQKITSTKFIKELWIESKNGSSIDFEVAKDSEINKFEANEIVIRNVYSVTF